MFTRLACPILLALSLPAWSAAVDAPGHNRHPHAASVPGSILVKFAAGTSPRQVHLAMQAAGATPMRALELVPGLMHARVNSAAQTALLAALSANPLVAYAEPDYRVHATLSPDDALYSLQWGLHNSGQNVNGTTGVVDADIDMPEGWNATTGGNGCLVAVLDTGVQWSHPDLDAQIWNNPGEIAGNGLDDDGNGYVDDIRGWDFYSGDNNPNDENGHGTHVAGTIAAESDNGIGVAGIAWDCKVMPLRFLGPNGGSVSDAIAALEYAVDKGVRISNNSWGSDGYSQALYDAIATARDAGHVFVAAAGNDGRNTDTEGHYPSAYDLDNIVSVAATDSRDQLAGFSNYGSASVDLGAPGRGVTSTFTGSRYVYLNGTSMASPHVAGVLALMLVQSPGLAYDQAIAQLLATVRPLDALAGRTVTGGMLDARAALDGQADDNLPPVVTISKPLDGALFKFGAGVTFIATAQDPENGNLAASLVWRSDRDGQIGLGAKFTTKTLSAGNHIVSASVTDGLGTVGEDSVNLRIETVPAKPTGTAAVNNHDGSATVSWTDNSNNETKFVIGRQTRTAGTWSATTLIGEVGANVSLYRDASGPGEFRYFVRAANQVGQSGFSNHAVVIVTAN